MKTIFRRAFCLILILLAGFLIYQHKLVWYGIGQLSGQLKIIYNAVPVSEVINHPDTNDSIRSKLLLIADARKFAIDSLGMKDSKNYTTYFDQKNKPLIWVVTGCKPYEMKAKEWWFPVIGNVSYKGFFDEEKARHEEARIRREGYDTDIYSPSAWSTLGYFKDPVLSNMLRRGPGRLAELIIHELTHATIYLKSSVTFNENFATFVGEQGAELFLLNRYGPESDELKRYRNFLHDENLYGNYMMQAAQQLDSVYKTFSSDMSTYEKAKLKYNHIAAVMAGIQHLPLNFPERYTFDFTKQSLPNNTEFMAFLRYRKELAIFNDVLENIYGGSLKNLVTDLVKRTENDVALPF